jgi:hypothetical protein
MANQGEDASGWPGAGRDSAHDLARDFKLRDELADLHQLDAGTDGNAAATAGVE